MLLVIRAINLQSDLISFHFCRNVTVCVSSAFSFVSSYRCRVIPPACQALNDSLLQSPKIQWRGFTNGALYLPTRIGKIDTNSLSSFPLSDKMEIEGNIEAYSSNQASESNGLTSESTILNESLATALTCEISGNNQDEPTLTEIVEEMDAEEDPFAMLRQTMLFFEDEVPEPEVGSKKVSKKLQKKLFKKAKLLEAKEKKADKQQKTKPRVSHFVAIQVTSPEIKEQVKIIQEKILSSPLPEKFKMKGHTGVKAKAAKKKKGKKAKVEENPDHEGEPKEEEEEEHTATIFKDAMERLESLHFTLSVVALQNDDEIERAKQVIESCWTKHKQAMETNPIDLDIHGLDHFANKVIYAKIKNLEHISRLQSLADDLKDEFAKSDIFQDASPFKAHMTIAKTSRSKKLYKKKIRAFPAEIWNDHGDHYFGKQQVESLQLLQMARDPETSYYKLVAEHKFEANNSSSDEIK